MTLTRSPTFLTMYFQNDHPLLLNVKVVQFKRESWVEGGCDVIQSNNATSWRHNLFQGEHRQKTHDEG